MIFNQAIEALKKGEILEAINYLQDLEKMVFLLMVIIWGQGFIDKPFIRMPLANHRKNSLKVIQNVNEILRREKILALRHEKFLSERN